MKSGEIAVPLNSLVWQLMIDARGRKLRARERLNDLRGDSIREPVRGPNLSNGRPSPAWLFYKRAICNHRRVTDQITALISLLPNTPGQARPEKVTQ